MLIVEWWRLKVDEVWERVFKVYLSCDSQLRMDNSIGRKCQLLIWENDE